MAAESVCGSVRWVRLMPKIHLWFRGFVLNAVHALRNAQLGQNIMMMQDICIIRGRIGACV